MNARAISFGESKPLKLPQKFTQGCCRDPWSAHRSLAGVPMSQPRHHQRFAAASDRREATNRIRSDTARQRHQQQQQRRRTMAHLDLVRIIKGAFPNAAIFPKVTD